MLEDLSSDQIEGNKRAILAKIKQAQQNPDQFAFKGKAELIAMCSQEEINKRLAQPGENKETKNFESDKNGFNPDLAIAEFKRSAADREMNNPALVRPAYILKLTVDYLRECIVDQDKLKPGQSSYPYGVRSQGEHNFLDIYSFTRDRFRQISQEFTVQQGDFLKEKIYSYEQMARFYIISLGECYCCDEGTFSSQQNNERLTEYLGILDDLYRKVKKTYPDPSDYTRRQLLEN